jgi:hypothetical protein
MHIFGLSALLSILVVLVIAGAIVCLIVAIIEEIPVSGRIKNIGYMIVFLGVLIYLMKLFNVTP